jgi:hypothetical protein
MTYTSLGSQLHVFHVQDDPHWATHVQIAPPLVLFIIFVSLSEQSALQDPALQE